MSAHTPGPWRVEVRTDVGPMEVKAGDLTIAHCFRWNRSNTLKVIPMVANAQLIAAAPALLDSVRELVAACAAAMRVIADLDAGKLLNVEAETREKRFVEELAAAGVQNGFGRRANDLIAKINGAQS